MSGWSKQGSRCWSPKQSRKTRGRKPKRQLRYERGAPMATSERVVDESVLEQFGYRQQFQRAFRRFASFAIGFSFISITTGIFTTYGPVLLSSGPLGIWTWPLVIVGQLAVALVFG